MQSWRKSILHNTGPLKRYNHTKTSDFINICSQKQKIVCKTQLSKVPAVIQEKIKTSTCGRSFEISYQWFLYECLAAGSFNSSCIKRERISTRSISDQEHSQMLSRTSKYTQQWLQFELLFYSLQVSISNDMTTHSLSFLWKSNFPVWQQTAAIIP